MPDFEELITTSLHRQAGQVDTSRRLAEEAYKRGRKVRTIRRVTAAVACVAALAVGVPLGVQHIGADGRHTPVEPAGTAPARTEPHTDPHDDPDSAGDDDGPAEEPTAAHPDDPAPHTEPHGEPTGSPGAEAPGRDRRRLHQTAARRRPEGSVVRGRRDPRR
ncbi:hypothetical protein [Actinopolymorpha pittospori]